MALTPAQRRALQLRHLAAIARGEAQLRTAVAATLTALAVVINDPEATPTEQSAAVTTAEQEADAEWLLLLLLLFGRRYDEAGGDPARRRWALSDYEDRVRPLLHGAISSMLERIRDGADPETVIDNEAVLVARTQVISAWNGGAFRGLAGEPDLWKMWLSLRDTKVRPTHMQADGQTVAFDQKFTVGGHTCDYPGDPSLPASEACNCRCVLIVKNDLNSPVIAASGAEMTDLPNGWEGVMAPLDYATGDDRYLATPPGGVRSGQLPLSFTLRHVSEGDDTPIGTVEEMWVGEIEGIEGRSFMFGRGRLDLGSEEGAEYARRLHEGFADTGSITPDEVTFEQRFMAPDGAFVDIEQATQLDSEGYLELKKGYRVINVMSDWRFRNFSAVSIPAFDEARISPVYDYRAPSEADAEADLAFEVELKKRKKAGKKWPNYEDYALVDEEEVDEAVVAAVGGQVFNKAFFDRGLKLDGPTPLTVTADGHVYGHVALFDSCYMQMGTNGGGSCMKPPVDADFSRFESHAAWFGGDDTARCGLITFGEGHRTAGSLRASQALYANVATGAAKVVVGMDKWGYFVTGEVLEQFKDRAYDLLLSPLSGHWEPDMDAKGKLRMIAAHVVVTPGYHVPRVAATFSDDGEIDSVRFSGPAPKIGPDLQAALRAKLALRKLASR